MGWFGLLHDIKEKHKAVATGEISASEIQAWRKHRAAEVKAARDRFEAMVSPPLLSSGTTTTGTSSGRMAGFAASELFTARKILRSNNIPQEELCRILEVYCRVLNKTRGEEE